MSSLLGLLNKCCNLAIASPISFFYVSRFDGMTYGEIEAAAPEEFLERQRLKIFMAQSRLLFMSNIV